jgi:hypothetical protein
MKDLVGATDWKPDEVLRALRGIDGHREWKFRYELLTSSGIKIRELDNVLGGTIANDFTAEIKRTAKFTILDDGSINYLSQRIRPWAGIMMPDGTFMEWPMGVFLLTSPKRSVDISGTVVRDVEAYDQTMVLIDDVVTARYYVGPNVEYTAAISELLANTQGIIGYSIVSSTTRTVAALEWEPGTSKSQIINDLLAAINYEGLWFDSNGTARAAPYVSPADREAEFTYQTDDVSTILPDAEVDVDYYKVPNRWVLIVSNPDQPPLRAEIVNNDPFSPTSTINRGRVVTRVIPDATAPNQGVLNDIAQRYRDEDGQLFETVAFKSGLMPIHENGDVFDFAYFDLNVAGRFLELSWSVELIQGSEMTHTLRRTISVLSGFGVGPFGLMPFGG